MQHLEQKRIIDGAKTAYLFIHGIAGTPNHFHMLLKRLPQDVSFHNLLLDGHGKSPRDFGKSSMHKWETQAACAVEELCRTHDEIYIVAHSMGTLFAMEQAIRQPKIKKLFLLAVPITVGVKLRMAATAAKLYFGRVRQDDLFTLAARDCCGIQLSKNPLPYLRWIPRFLELFRKIHDTRQILGQLQTPCIAIQSALDELVSPKSISYLKKHAPIQVEVLPDSTHFYYAPEDKKRLLQAFDNWMK
ncbi:MAG: alpha/beta fold hydrolase [Clostridia bacterium]|nr:alpha/beta fold hydrolase [Clostridia bacterium]